jgi:hypothetical protein
MKRKICMFLVVSALFISANAQYVSERKLQAFDKIKVFGDLDVRLYQSDTFKLVFEAKDSSFFSKIKVSNEKSELKLSMMKSLFRDNKNVRISVYFNNLHRLEADASAMVNSETLIKGDSIEIEALSGANVNVELDMQSIIASVGQNSTITTEGKTERQYVSGGSGGVYSGYRLECKNTVAKSNTGARVKVTGYDVLDISATTGGFIGIWGLQKKKKISTSSGGKIAWAKKITEY